MDEIWMAHALLGGDGESHQLLNGGTVDAEELIDDSKAHRRPSYSEVKQVFACSGGVGLWGVSVKATPLFEPHHLGKALEVCNGQCFLVDPIHLTHYNPLQPNYNPTRTQRYPPRPPRIYPRSPG